MSRIPSAPGQSEAQMHTKLGELIVDAWEDPAKRLELLSDPKGKLQACGEDVSLIQVIVHEDTESTVHLVLPKKPDGYDSQTERRPFIAKLGAIVIAGCR